MQASAVPADTAGPIGPRSRTRGLITPNSAVVAIPAGTKAVSIYCSILSRVGVGTLSSVTASVQEAQTITKGDATSGNLTLGFQGQTTGSLAWNVSAANVVAGLVAISSVGAAGVTATGGTLDSAPIVVTFAAGILDGDQPLLVPTTVDLAGGVSAASRLPTVAETTTATNVLGFVSGDAELIFPLKPTDAYVYIKGDNASATGAYRIGWFS